MRIDAVYLRDVGPFQEVKIDFQPRVSADKADVHIFVGPNGSGKSTLLYAMAAVVGGPSPQLGAEHAARRLRSDKSLIGAKLGKGTAALSLQQPNPIVSFSDPFDAKSALQTARTRENLGWSDSSGSGFRDFWRQIEQFHARPPVSTPFTFAAFAYAGSRSLPDYRLVAIQEPDAGPLAQALSFDRTVAIDRLSQWLSSTFAKRAFARETNKPEDASRYNASIERIESAVRSVIGGDLVLRTSYEPLQIVVERNGVAISLDLLPDGLKSILSWVADLLMRLDRIPWENDVPLLDRPFVLFLDEIDIHLHPAWQRRILPMVQSLFPKAQIFVTTHSPFVVSSVEGAWVYPLRLQADGTATADPPVESQAGTSFATVLRSLFGIDERFDDATERALDAFYATRARALSGDTVAWDQLRAEAQTLAERSIEVRNIVFPELYQVAKKLGREP